MKPAYAIDFEGKSLHHKEAEKGRGHSPGKSRKTITGNLYQPAVEASGERLAVAIGPIRACSCVNACCPRAAFPQVSPQVHCC